MAEAMTACLDIDISSRHEDRIFKQPTEQGNIYLSKTPMDILVVKPILRVNPDLYVICMIRDPRDAVVSKHKSDPEIYWASLDIWKTYSPYFRELRKHPRCTVVRYEDFVSDPDRVQQRILKRLPFLKSKAPFSDYHLHAKPSKGSINALGGVRPIAPVGIGNYRNHLPRLAGQIQIHGSISDDLIEFGYEKDDNWTTILEGISPDLSEGHWPEKFTKQNFKRAQKGMYKEVIKTLLRRMHLDPGKIKGLIGLR